MSDLMWYVVAFTPAALGLGVFVIGGVVAFLRDPGGPETPEWEPRELAALTGKTGAHAIIGERAYEEIAPDTGHTPRHDENEIPPSIRVPALMLTVVERAKALTAELGNWNWRPSNKYRTTIFIGGPA